MPLGALVVLALPLATGHQAPDLRELVVRGPDGRPVPEAAVVWMPREEAVAKLYESTLPPFASELARILEEHGSACPRDGQGRPAVPRIDESILVAAFHPGLYVRREFAPHAEPPLELELEPDRTLAIEVVDSGGQPSAGVDVVLISGAGGPGGAIPSGPGAPPWVGRTGADGVARLEHAQWLMGRRSSGLWSLGLAIPLAEWSFTLVEPPGSEGPFQLELPPTGRVVVEMVHARRAWARIRPLPAGDPREDGVAGSGWWNRTPTQTVFVEGRAVFPHVGLGLELEVQAIWEGMIVPARLVRRGPTRPSQEVVIRVEGRQAPGGVPLDDPEPVFLDRTRELEPEGLLLSGPLPGETETTLCVVRTDGNSPKRRVGLVLGGQVLVESGAHGYPADGEWHDCLQLDEDQAEAVSRHFQVPIARRVDRPYSLRTEWSSDKDAYAPGEPIVVELAITNAGPDRLAVRQRGRRVLVAIPGRGLDFTVRVLREGQPLEDVYVRTLSPTISSVRALGPGQTVVMRAELSSRVGLKQPGTYDVEATFELPLPGSVVPFDPPRGCPWIQDDYVDRLHGRLEVVVH